MFPPQGGKVQADDSLDTTFPGWGSTNSVTVTAGLGRLVFATFTISGDSDSLARIEAQVEDSSGTMQTVQELEVPSGLASDRDNTITVFVPNDRSYQFVRTGNAGVTETNEHYSTVDLG